MYTHYIQRSGCLDHVQGVWPYGALRLALLIAVDGGCGRKLNESHQLLFAAAELRRVDRCKDLCRSILNGFSQEINNH